MQKSLILLGKALANCLGLVLVCSMIAASFYISVRNVVAESNGDFGMFWQVGHKIVIGDIAPIYTAAPKATAESPLDPYLVFFCYPPHSAAACTPLGLLPLKTSMGVFIAVQTAALLFASALFAYSQAAKQSLLRFLPRAMLITLVAATTFLPMAMTMSLGQPGVLIGFLPITAAYVAMTKGRYQLAGIILGVLVLKPQFLLPLGLLAIACLLASFRARKQESCAFITTNELVKLAIGFAITASVIVALGLSLFGIEGYLMWLQRLRSSVDFVYAHTGFEGYQEPYEMIASLSMAIAFQCQQIPTAIVKSATSIFLFAAALVEIFLLYRIASSSLSKRNKLDLTLVTALLSLPVISPYFRIYDLSLVVLSAWIIFLGSPSTEKRALTIAKLLTFAFWLFVDFRCLLIPQEIALKLTWINMAFVIAVTIYALSIFLLLRPREKH